MTNKALLEQLGWPEELVAECERTAATLNAGLPSIPRMTEEPPGSFTVDGRGVDLLVEPVATGRLYFVSNQRK